MLGEQLLKLPTSWLEVEEKKEKTFLEFYREFSVAQATRNIQECSKEAKRILEEEETTKEGKKLLKKIQNYLDRTGLQMRVASVLKQITENELVASQFSKDPIRQNISERTQMEFLKLKGIEITKLAGASDQAWRFLKGTGILTQTNKSKNTTHSLDFERVGSEWHDFIMGKTTIGEGGIQNHQREEMVEILKEMELYISKNDDNKRFVLLLDGDHYNLEDLRELTSSNRILITDSNEYV
jgi:hypothetical protein